MMNFARPARAAIALAFLMLPLSPSQASLLNSHWKFDESSGTNAADSVSALDGTLVNGAAFTTGGKLGNYVTLDGSNDRVTVTDNAAHRPTTIGVSIWVNSTDSGIFRGVWDKILSSVGFLLDMHSGVARVTTDAVSLSRGTSINDGTWHQVLGIFDSSNGDAFIYVDGSLKATNTSAIYTPQSTTLAMGGDGASTFALNGGLDDAAVWNDVLTDAEAAALYNVADHASLLYDAGDAELLFSLHRAGSGSVLVDGKTWYYTTSLSGGLGAVNPIGGSDFSIRLTAGGTGLTTVIPEPASLTLIAAASILLLRRGSRAW